MTLALEQVVTDTVDCPRCGQARRYRCGRLYRNGTFLLLKHPHKERIGLYRAKKGKEGGVAMNCEMEMHGRGQPVPDVTGMIQEKRR